MSQNEQYGSWKSSISADLVASKTIRFAGLELVDKVIYWSEKRPSEKGRVTILSSNEENSVNEMLSSKYSAKTKVHEYGGVSFFVLDKKIFFISENDQGIYQIDSSGKVSKIIAHKKCRYADLTINSHTGLIFAVKEESKKEHVINTIVSIDLESK